MVTVILHKDSLLNRHFKCSTPSFRGIEISYERQERQTEKEIETETDTGRDTKIDRGRHSAQIIQRLYRQWTQIRNKE